MSVCLGTYIRTTDAGVYERIVNKGRCRAVARLFGTRPENELQKLDYRFFETTDFGQTPPGGDQRRFDDHRTVGPRRRSDRRLGRLLPTAKQRLSTRERPARSIFGRAGIGVRQHRRICCSTGAIWYLMVYDMPARERCVRRPKAATADGPCPPVHRAGGERRCRVGGPPR